MKKIKLKWFLILIVLNLSFLCVKAQKEEPVSIKSGTIKIEGTLLVPEAKEKVPVVLIIAGSGPTDRNGNGPMINTNCYKMLADELAKSNIASLRYDKRMIGKSTDSTLKESNLKFDDFIKDATLWINYLKKDKRFSDVIVVGHSQGSLVGMIAAERTKVDKFISLAGVSESIDQILKKQFSSQPPTVLDVVNPIIDSLAQGYMVKNVPIGLYSFFRKDVQPFLISWMKYNPQTEIAKLKIPVLIVQGTTDIQTDVDDAKKLHEANKDSKLVMSHRQGELPLAQ